MNLIARESARLNKFVTDLLSYSRERDLALEPVTLDDNLRELVNTLRHDPRRAAAVQVEFQAGPPEVRISVDAEQMRQVWLNLAANALEALGERGTLTVTWVARGADQVAVEFRDNGPRICVAWVNPFSQPSGAARAWGWRSHNGSSSATAAC